MHVLRYTKWEDWPLMVSPIVSSVFKVKFVTSGQFYNHYLLFVFLLAFFIPCFVHIYLYFKRWKVWFKLSNNMNKHMEGNEIVYFCCHFWRLFCFVCRVLDLWAQFESAKCKWYNNNNIGLVKFADSIKGWMPRSYALYYMSPAPLPQSPIPPAGWEGMLDRIWPLPPVSQVTHTFSGLRRYQYIMPYIWTPPL